MCKKMMSRWMLGAVLCLNLVVCGCQAEPKKTGTQPGESEGIQGTDKQGDTESEGQESTDNPEKTTSEMEDAQSTDKPGEMEDAQGTDKPGEMEGAQDTDKQGDEESGGQEGSGQESTDNSGETTPEIIVNEGTPFTNNGKNPIVTSIYTADPAPMVVGDTLYLYTSHDEDELINGFYTMRDWRCYSTKDMVNWTDHGVVFSLDDIAWADDRAWAPQAIERNGKFYLYCPVHKKYGGMAIAVGVSDSPTGPFKDTLVPVVNEGDWNDIDPTVFIDDDGQAYLYFGNPELRYVLLKEDMISYDKSVGVVKVPMTEESFGKGAQPTGTTYAEGPWFYKRNGIYYMVYAAFGEGKGNEHLAYSTADSPTGPWRYGGVLMTEEGGTFTNHPGVIDFKGHSYLFYHTGELPGGSLFHRSVCVAEFQYNPDGSIDTIKKCSQVNAIE